MTEDLSEVAFGNKKVRKKNRYTSRSQPGFREKLAVGSRAHWNLTKLIPPVHLYSFEVTFLMVLECNML